MREYVIRICFAIVFCSGINLLIPHKRYEGIIKIVCGVFVVFTIISPIRDILFDTDYFDSLKSIQYDDWGFYDITKKSRQDFKDVSLNDTEKEISSYLTEKFSDEVSVELVMTEDDIKAYVKCSYNDFNSIKGYLQSAYSIKAEFAG